MCTSCEWRVSNARDRRRRRDEEMVPDDPAALGVETVCLQSLQSRAERPTQEHVLSNVFPAPASPDERAFFPMPGRWLHDVAMGERQSAPDRAAQGILRPGGCAFHVHRAVTRPALR